MGLFDKFKKGKTENEEVTAETLKEAELSEATQPEPEEAQSDPETIQPEESTVSSAENTEKTEEAGYDADKFLLGVVDVFQVKDSEDLVVVGMLRGTLAVGDKVHVSNPGDDMERVFTTKVLTIENGPDSRVQEAKDCRVAVRLAKAKQHPFKIGSVVYYGDVSDKELQENYISALGDGYIMAKKVELSEGDILRMSLTDCAEVWRLFAWFRSNALKSQDDAEAEDTKRKVDMLGKALCKKVLSAEAIYCIYNKKTGEPHLFSRTMKQNGKYACTPPDIMIFTEAYRPIIEPNYTNDMTEVRKIENGADKNGIYSFLAEAIYLNGAAGVMVLSEQVGIAAQMLVPEPNYADVTSEEVPVQNPDLMRWMLLMTQLPKPETEDQKVIYNIYYQFMAKEMVKAKFLIPTKNENEFATTQGRFEKDAVRMYTDEKRLRMAYDEAWNIKVKKMESVIDSMDCAVNMTEYKDAGVYVGKKMYKEMKNIK